MYRKHLVEPDWQAAGCHKLVEEYPDHRHRERPLSLTPGEMGLGVLRPLVDPEFPSGEDAVEESLNEHRAEEVFAIDSFEAQAQFRLKRTSQCCKRPHLASVLHALESGACVGSEEPGKISGSGKRRVAEGS